jgi:hypothetical protein
VRGCEPDINYVDHVCGDGARGARTYVQPRPRGHRFEAESVSPTLAPGQWSRGGARTRRARPCVEKRNRIGHGGSFGVSTRYDFEPRPLLQAQPLWIKCQSLRASAFPVMKLISEYLELSVHFERLAAEQDSAAVREQLLKQAAEYLKLAEEKAAQLGSLGRLARPRSGAKL